MIDVEHVADEIVSRLFRNGMGEEAQRLVLELEGGRDGGGWCRDAVKAQIVEQLNWGLECASAESSD